MQIEFLNRLNESQLTDLINYVLEKKATKDGNTLAKKVEDIGILNEADRCDSEGNQEIMVNAWNGSLHIGGYFINDYEMRDSFREFASYSDELREYMVSVFGTKYLEGLKNYYRLLASKEEDRLRPFIGGKELKLINSSRDVNIS